MDIHATSFVIFNTFLIPVTFFSFVYYLVALRSIMPGGEKTKEKEREEGAEEAATDWPRVTIQIPTYNEPVAIRCAESCLQSDYPKEKFEIMIGDDSKDTKVSESIDEFARKHPDKIRVTRRGSNSGFKAGNLNHMLRLSKGEIIVIFDSDFIAEPDFLKRIVRPFLDDDNVGGTQAEWEFINEGTNYVSKLASTLLMFYYSLIIPINKKAGTTFLFGSGEAVRKDLLLKMGGWQEGSLTEDTEFSLRLFRKGYKVVHPKDLKVKGELPYTLKGLMSQQRRWAYGNTRAFMEHAKPILLGPFSSFQKIMISYTTSIGYLSNLLLLLFLVFGFVYFFSQPPAPVDFWKFFDQTSRIFLATSGFLSAGVIALFKKRKMHILGPSIFSIMTIGVFVSFSVCVGFFKAITGRDLAWSAINKEGNLTFALQRQ